jgi:hypothetical protein
MILAYVKGMAVIFINILIILQSLGYIKDMADIFYTYDNNITKFI